MTWTKLGAEYPDQAAALSDAAFRTHTEALCWSNRRLLDLLIPKTHVRRFAETPDPNAAVAELLAAGWWEDRGDDGWYIGCHFADWQRDRVQVEHLRQRKASDQRRKRRHDLGDHSLCIPGRCKALSPGDTSGDSPGDWRGDPEQNGTAQEQDGLDASTTEENEHHDEAQLLDDFLDGRRPANWPANLPHSSDASAATS